MLFPVRVGGVRHHRLHPWAFVKFVVFVLYSLVMSSWAVIKVDPAPDADRAARRDRPGPPRAESPLTATIVANAITLTPGHDDPDRTARSGRAHVHVLGLGDTDEFRDSVEDLERRVVAALTPQLRRPPRSPPPTAADLGRDPT